MYRVDKYRSLVLVLNQMNPANTIFYFNIILPTVPRYFKQSVLYFFRLKFCLHFLFLCPTHLPFVDLFILIIFGKVFCCKLWSLLGLSSLLVIPLSPDALPANCLYAGLTVKRLIVWSKSDTCSSKGSCLNKEFDSRIIWKCMSDTLN
jgi:hypothetical protein